MKSAGESPKEISLAGRRVESTRLSAESDRIDANLTAFTKLMGSLSSRPTSDDTRHRLLWRGIPKDMVADFLDDFQADDKESLFLPGNLSRFVRRARADHLQTWDVVVIDGSRNKELRPLPGAPMLSYFPPERTVRVSEKEFRISGKSSRLAGTADVASMVSQEARDRIKKKYLEKQESVNESGKRDGTTSPNSGPGEIDYYSELERPVLFIYPLEVLEHKPDDTEKTKPTAASILEGRPLIAVKIAIKRSGVNDPSADVIYVINKVAQRAWFPEFTDDEADDELDE